MYNKFYVLSKAPIVSFKSVVKTLFINRLRWFSKHLPRYGATYRQLIEYSIVISFLDWYERVGKGSMIGVDGLMERAESDLDPTGELHQKIKELRDAATYFDDLRPRKVFDIRKAETRLESMMSLAENTSVEITAESAGIEAMRKYLYEDDTKHLCVIIKHREAMNWYRV